MLGLVGGAPGGGDTARRSREGLDDRLGEGFGRLRVLASDELSALRDDDMRRPRVALAVLAALAREALLVRAAEGLDGLRLADLETSKLNLKLASKASEWLCAGRRDDKLAD